MKLNVPLHILVNNAGGWFQGMKMTEDNLETMWESNYLSHYYLTELLLNHIKQSSISIQYGRIINVSSVAYRRACIKTFNGFLNDNVRNNNKFWEQYRSTSMVIYGDTKLAQIMHAKSLHNRLQQDNKPNYIKTASLHPGFVDSGFFTADDRGILARILGVCLTPFLSFIWLTPNQGAQTTLHCLLAEENDKDFQPGGFHLGCKFREFNDHSQEFISIMNTKSIELDKVSKSILGL